MAEVSYNGHIFFAISPSGGGFLQTPKCRNFRQMSLSQNPQMSIVGSIEAFVLFIAELGN